MQTARTNIGRRENTNRRAFILEKMTPIFITSNTEIHQHVSSQTDALASRYFRYEFETEMLRYPLCNDKHDNFITDTQWIQTLEEAETIQLSAPDSESETIDADLQEGPIRKRLKTATVTTGNNVRNTLHRLTDEDLLAVLIWAYANWHQNVLTFLSRLPTRCLELRYHRTRKNIRIRCNTRIRR